VVSVVCTNYKLWIQFDVVCSETVLLLVLVLKRTAIPVFETVDLPILERIGKANTDTMAVFRKYCNILAILKTVLAILSIAISNNPAN